MHPDFAVICVSYLSASFRLNSMSSNIKNVVNNSSAHRSAPWWAKNLVSAGADQMVSMRKLMVNVHDSLCMGYAWKCLSNQEEKTRKQKAPAKAGSLELLLQTSFCCHLHTNLHV